MRPPHLALSAIAVLMLGACIRAGFWTASGAPNGDRASGDAGPAPDRSARDGALDGNPACPQALAPGYVFCRASISWDEAEQRCNGVGMHLAKIATATEDAAVLQQGRSSLGSNAGALWLGGTDRDHEGTWVWPDGTIFYSGGAAAGYQHFGSGEPNNASGVENCLELRLDNGGGLQAGEWNDGRCDLRHNFVCGP